MVEQIKTIRDLKNFIDGLPDELLVYVESDDNGSPWETSYIFASCRDGRLYIEAPSSI